MTNHQAIMDEILAELPQQDSPIYSLILQLMEISGETDVKEIKLVLDAEIKEMSKDIPGGLLQ
jgi:hypothetical protein